MKKTFLLLLALMMLLSACSEPALSPIEKCQQKAISIGEQYLNYEITGEDARKQLNDLRVPETEGNGQSHLTADINWLAFVVAKQDATYADIEEAVERLRTRTYTDTEE